MINLKFEHILLSLFLSSGSTVGGWALTVKLAGKEAALSFLQIGVISVILMFGVQIAFFLLGKKRLVYRILFNIAFSGCLVWFMLCLLLPVIWMNSVSGAEKSLLFLILFALCATNVRRGGSLFAASWEKEGERALARHYNNKNNTIDWAGVIAPMKFSVALHVPGVPEQMNPFASVLIIVSMLVGLSLRNVFPTVSLFAWGIPSCLVISLLVQMIGLGIAQISTVLTLEKRYGVIIGLKT